MVDYIPLEDVDPFQSSSEVINAEVDKFHLSISSNSVEFSRENQEKSILITNIGWGKLPFAGIIFVGSGFTIYHELPVLLLPKYSYPLAITSNPGVSSVEGGIYIDVGNSYGNKFILLSGNFYEEL